MKPTLVTGRVVDAEGNPVRGASVFFARGPVPLPDIAQVSGDDGVFSLSAPEVGVYTIVVNAPGHPLHEHEIEVQPNAANVSIILE